MVEHKEIKHHEKKGKIKISKLQLFQFLTAILAIALVASIALRPTTGMVFAGDANKIGEKTVEYINTNLLPEGIVATYINGTTENGMYKLTIDIQNQSTEIYVNKENTMLFPSAIDMTKDLQKPAAPAQQPTGPFDAPNTTKPVVQLFVMSFCPYGQQAEDTMLPVVELLKGKVIVEPHFIVSVEGTTVNSLHGEYEANENMRQACIVQEYSVDKFWEYVKVFNGACSSSNIDTCWKEKAQVVGIDVAKIESCFGTDGINLMKAEQALSESYGVQGSPTLIINDAEYSGARTPDAYKLGICSGFTTQPTECAQTLSANGTVAAGNC